MKLAYRSWEFLCKSFSSEIEFIYQWIIEWEDVCAQAQDKVNHFLEMFTNVCFRIVHIDSLGSRVALWQNLLKKWYWIEFRLCRGLCENGSTI